MPLVHPSGNFESDKERNAYGKNQRGEFVVMSWLPGWNTIAGAHTWESAFFWGSIIALILLGVTEVASHRAAQRKDELTEQQQSETQRRHDEEMARLRLQTAELTERAAQATLELERIKRPRILSPDQQARFTTEMTRFSGQTVVIGTIPTTFEAASFAEQLVRLLIKAGIAARIDQQLAATEVGSSRSVVVRFVTGNTRGEELGKTFCAILTDDGIPAHAVGGLTEQYILKYNWARNDASLSSVVIVVGDKE